MWIEVDPTHLIVWVWVREEDGRTFCLGAFPDPYHWEV